MAADFFNTPLVTWVHTFHHGHSALEYKDFYNGVFLNQVMQQIDSSLNIEKSSLVQEVEDIQGRLQNWDVLLRNLKHYYHDVLQQLVVMKLPNILTICRDPESDAAQEEIQKVLLLILGCAVQCERKEDFIDNIKQLDITVQHAIVVHIKEITDENENVIEIPSHDSDSNTKAMYLHLERLVEERDQSIKDLNKLHVENDSVNVQLANFQRLPLPMSPPTTPEKHHLGVELAECKAKLRRLRQEVEEKNEIVTELKEELEDQRGIVGKLRHENLQLTQDARSARTYRDELDVLREKASRVDKFESEITKYKEKLNELEFFKARVEELRDDNKILIETKNMLEDQLSSSHKRVETVIELENELMKYKQQVEELCAERDHERSKLQELAEENARLEFEKKSSLNESANLEQELENARSQIGTGLSGTLSDQLNDTTNSKILRLELENQRLQKHLDELKEKTMMEHHAKILELEKENHRLSKKVEKYQDSSCQDAKGLLELEQKNRELTKEKNKLLQTLEAVKMNAERQRKELEKDKEQLAETVKTIRDRNEKTMDTRTREIERENKLMHENVRELKTCVTRLEFDNARLKEQLEKMKEEKEKVVVLTEEQDKLEKQNTQLHTAVASLKLSVDKAEKVEERKNDLELENKNLMEVIAELKVEISRLEKSEKENITLTVENKRLQRTLGMLRNSSSKLVTLDTEKDDQEKEIEKLKKKIEDLKFDRAKQEQLEVDLLDLDTENQKMQKTLEATTSRAQNYKQEIGELESENDKLSKTIENLRLSLRKYEDLEKENRELESENRSAAREKDNLEKENKRLKQSVSSKDSTIDDLSNKLTELEREHKNVRKSLDKSVELSTKVKDLEKENKDLLQQASIDKKTLSTLREDLVNEKIKTQQLTNELEKLTQELERIGINKEKLAVAEQSQDESRYKALESMMEDAFKKSMEIKDEKILALESRLEESKNRNAKLQEQLKGVKRDYEALKQRIEEEKTMVVMEEKPKNKSASLERAQTFATKEILELKDHLVDVERKNATLIAENSNLKSQTSSLQNRLDNVESEKYNLHTQLASVQGQNTTLQSQNAKLQVENTTLQSQSASVLSQNGTLQSQVNSLESEHEQLRTNHDELQNAHEQLVVDHEALQQLHEQLTGEYEALISEHGSLKSNHKALKSEYQDLARQKESLLTEKKKLDEMKEGLSKERESLKSESKSLGNMQSEFGTLKEELERRKNSYDKLNHEYHDVMAEYKTVKTEYNQLKLKHTELQGDMAECKDQLNTMDVEVSKMANRCEALSHMNGKLEDENHQLIEQVRQLIQQNQELLTRALDSKEHFHEESRQYMEQLSDLRRHKEKLEEKIMEQYKNYDRSPKKTRGFGANLVRKAKGFISRRKEEKRMERPKSMYDPRDSHDSPGDNSSLGSYGDSLDGEGILGLRKDDRHRHQDFSDSPKLSKHNRNLAKSTTALNYNKQNNMNSDRSFGLRGARSTEDLLNCESSPRSDGGHTADIDSLSSSTNSWHFLTVPRNKKKGSYDFVSSQNNLSAQRANQVERIRQGSISSEDNIPTRDLGPHSGEAPLEGHKYGFYSKGSTPRDDSPRPRASSSNSPGNEEITLEQFLMETCNTSPPVKNEDPKKFNIDAKPEPDKDFNRPSSNRPSPRDDPSLRNFTSHLPELSSLPSRPVGHAQSELNISKVSHISAPALNNVGERRRESIGSAGSYDSPRVSSRSAADLKTSTPKTVNQNLNNAPYTIRSFAERQKQANVENEVSYSSTPVRETVNQFNRLDSKSPGPSPRERLENETGGRFSRFDGQPPGVSPRGQSQTPERQAAQRLDMLTGILPRAGAQGNYTNSRGDMNDLSNGGNYLSKNPDLDISSKTVVNKLSRDYQESGGPGLPVAPPRRTRMDSPRRGRAPSPPRRPTGTPLSPPVNGSPRLSHTNSVKRRAPSPPVKQPRDNLQNSELNTNNNNTPSRSSHTCNHNHKDPQCRNSCYQTPFVRMTGFKQDDVNKKLTDTSSPSSAKSPPPPTNNVQSPNANKSPKDPSSPENSIWYEYGCV